MRAAIEGDLAARRDALPRFPTLGRLAARLERLLGDLLARPLYLPRAKALLSRDGGLCPRDGTRLAFDPYGPHGHRCPRCGEVFDGERHHRAWVTSYQLWLSERAVHLALLGAVLDRPALSARSAEILDAYASRYRSYPNADNVLGPTRLFFSTYLESIWLVQLGVAAMLVEATGRDLLPQRAWRALRATVTESAALIASFDERWSNRQVWNAAALVATGALLGREDLVALGARGGSGLRSLLGAVGGDGLWHEGENYHLFALRGFLLGAEILRWRRDDLYRGTRLGAMYAAPLATLLPDLTLPARGDAPYGVSVRQPRFAELWEIGRARTGDPRLAAMLARLYGDEAPELEDAGLLELAEQERNRPPHRQHRDRLGWKALLWMEPDDPAGAVAPEASRLLHARGVAVLRDASRRVVSLECGPPARGGGHGHPDRLHLSLYWDAPILADFGTGSYVSPSLHWYRSTLAHNAPARAGVGQLAGTVACDAFARDGVWQWCRVRGDGILGAGTTVSRSLVLGPDLVLDTVTVEAPPDAVTDLPVHPLRGVAPTLGPADASLPGAQGAGHETGYDRIALVGGLARGGEGVTLEAGGVALHLAPRAEESLLVARAPGPPGADLTDGPPLDFLIRRAAGAGRWVLCAAPRGRSCAVREEKGDVVVTLDGRIIRFAERGDGMVIHAAGAPPVRLSAGRWPAPPTAPARPAAAAVLPLRLADQVPSLDAWPEGGPVFDLGSARYRRSEEPYGAAGRFRARVAVIAHGDALCFRFDVVKDDPVFRHAADPDPALDNEPADIHSDGVQCYVGRARWAGVLAVPEPERRGVRVRPVAGTVADPALVTGESRRTPEGYQVLVRVGTGRPLRPGERVRFAAVVNEMRPGRQRRAGQLALAGGGWVYLRGDRESPDEAVEAEIA